MGDRKKGSYAKLHVWHLPGRSIQPYAPYSAYEADVVRFHFACGKIKNIILRELSITLATAILGVC